jgi:pimeloyl-ACP methyl ester carboxylesterase
LTIIGHSAGTRLAISYAAQYPERVARLLLVTPPSTYLVDEPADAAELIGERSGDPVFDKAVAAFQGGADLSDETAFNAWQQACAPVGYAAWTAGEQKHAQLEKLDLAAAQAFQRAATGRSGRKARCGEGTDIGARCRAGLSDGCAAGEGAGEAFPNGDVVLIDQCGHYPWVERPAEFRRAADTFLGGHD